MLIMIPNGRSVHGRTVGTWKGGPGRAGLGNIGETITTQIKLTLTLPPFLLFSLHMMRLFTILSISHCVSPFALMGPGLTISLNLKVL
jgi:hypothetical protein